MLPWSTLFFPPPPTPTCPSAAPAAAASSSSCPALALAVLALALSVGVLRSAPHSALDWALLVPFALVMAWEGLVVWQLVLGFAAWLRGPEALSRWSGAPRPWSPGPPG